MKIIFRANGRCASADVEPSGQPVTAGSRGIMTEFELSEDYAGLVVYAVFRSQTATRDVLLSENFGPAVVPWEVLARPSLTFDVGVVGKNGDGDIVIPTIWATVGRVMPGAEASGIEPADPSADIGTQIVEQAREAARQAEDAADEAQQSEDDAADNAKLAESWAVGETGTRPGEDTDNAKYYAKLAEQQAAEGGWIRFYIDKRGYLHYVKTPNTEITFYLRGGYLYASMGGNAE